jgi:DNA-binding LytR/AlgR family response regulator
MNQVVKVLVVDDEINAREGLRSLLAEERDAFRARFGSDPGAGPEQQHCRAQAQVLQFHLHVCCS